MSTCVIHENKSGLIQDTVQQEFSLKERANQAWGLWINVSTPIVALLRKAAAISYLPKTRILIVSFAVFEISFAQRVPA
jgi:hypothetical protein